MDKNTNKKPNENEKVEDKEVKKEGNVKEEKHEENQEMEELKKKAEELEDKYKRALADYQNLEKRVREEKSQWIMGSNKELILHFLPILDTLMLTEKHIKIKDEGLSLSIQQFLGILKTEGVEKIDSLGKNYDPTLMQCLETITGEDGKVLEDVRTGYLLHGNVLRPSLVKVGKK